VIGQRPIAAGGSRRASGDPLVVSLPPEAAPLKVEMLNVGWISSSAALWHQGEPPEQRIRFPVPAYLIETQQERILRTSRARSTICAFRRSPMTSARRHAPLSA